MRTWVVGIVVLLCLADAVGAEERKRTHTFRTTDGIELRYRQAGPTSLEDGKTYPVLIALPPGNQQSAMVEWGLRTYWEAEANRRGWIVIAPIRTGEDLLFERARGHFAELVRHLAERFSLEGGKVHLAGVSNGGMSAFRAAISHPELVHSLLALPGFPPTEGDFGRLGRLKPVTVAMYVGADDEPWVPQMKRARDALVEAGSPATLTIMPAEGHVVRSLRGGRALFDVLDGARRAP